MVSTNVCGFTFTDLDGVEQDEAGLIVWCGLSEELYGKTGSAFWNCIGDCVWYEHCDEGCIDDCTQPADPGGGCGHTVHGVYDCEVAFHFPDTRLWIPEMDLHETCDMTTDDWECYQECVDSECDGGADQGDDWADCVNANC